MLARVEVDSVERLSRAECLELLRHQTVGRLVVTEDERPLVFPVNYVMAGEDVVFYTNGGTKLEALDRRSVAFEVDEFDRDAQSGWSVYLYGAAHEVDVGVVADVLRRIGGPAPTPWAPGSRNHLVQLVAREVTGRRIAASQRSVGPADPNAA